MNDRDTIGVADVLKDSVSVGMALAGTDWTHGDDPAGLRWWLALVGQDNGASGGAVWAAVEAALANPAIRKVKAVGTNAEGERVVAYVNRRGVWVLHMRLPEHPIRTWEAIAYPDYSHGISAA